MRLIVGLSGTSGIIYGIRMREVLRDLDIETDLVMTGMAAKMVEIETGWKADEVRGLSTRCHDNNDFTSVLASGGYRNSGMVLLPCSMKTIAGIALANLAKKRYLTWRAASSSDRRCPD